VARKRLTDDAPVSWNFHVPAELSRQVFKELEKTNGGNMYGCRSALVCTLLTEWLETRKMSQQTLDIDRSV
jgi:hypothetical protein